MTATVIIARRDPEGEHYWGGEYVARWWSPVLGPSALLLGQLISRELNLAEDQPIIFDLEDAAWRLGNSNMIRFEKAWRRLQEFGPLRPADVGYSLPMFIGEVPARHQRRWTSENVEAHAQEVAHLLAEPW